MSQSIRTRTDYILPSIVAIMSVGGLINNHGIDNILNALVSILGIISVLLFLANKGNFVLLSKLWILLQLPVITVSGLAVWDAAQMVNFNLGFDFNKETSTSTTIALNILPFGLLILHRAFVTSSLLGRTVVVEKFRTDNKLGDVFPLMGEAVQKVHLSGEANWVLIKLNKDMVSKTTSYSHILSRPKEEETFSIGGKSQISFIRLAADPSLIVNNSGKKEDFPFIDWGRVRIEK